MVTFNLDIICDLLENASISVTTVCL